MNRTDAEAERILAEYRRRERAIPDDFYALHHPANLFIRHGQEEAILRGLRTAGFAPLGRRRVLEVGCGYGDWFGLFERFGAAPEHLAGIELNPERADEARRRFPTADVRTGNAAALPWPDASFEVVFQCTVFTSILDAEVRSAAACEMLRVLAPGGMILWLDFRYDNPRNAQVRGVGRGELRRLFPDCDLRLRRITLAPPIARRLVPWSWKLAQLLEWTTLLNTHYLAVIRKRQ